MAQPPDPGTKPPTPAPKPALLGDDWVDALVGDDADGVEWLTAQEDRHAASGEPRTDTGSLTHEPPPPSERVRHREPASGGAAPAPRVVNVTRSPHPKPDADPSAASGHMSMGPVRIGGRVAAGSADPDYDPGTWKQELRDYLAQDNLEGNVPRLYLDHKGLVTIGVGHLLASESSAVHMHDRLQFQLRHADGSVATTAEVQAEYRSIRAAGDAYMRKVGKKKFAQTRWTNNHPGHTPTLALSNEDRMALLQRDIDNKARGLPARFKAFKSWKYAQDGTGSTRDGYRIDAVYERSPSSRHGVVYETFEQLPPPAKKALTDMAFCMGLGSRRTRRGLFENFHAMLTAVREGRWEVAASESMIATPRNHYSRTKGAWVYSPRNIAIAKWFREAAAWAPPKREQQVHQRSTPAAKQATPATAPDAQPVTPRVNVIAEGPDRVETTPLVRLYRQFDRRWGSKRIHPTGIRWSKKKNKDVPRTWGSAGCFPCCLATILRWWEEDFPDTPKRLNYPHDPKRPHTGPRGAMQRILGSQYPTSNKAGTRVATSALLKRAVAGVTSGDYLLKSTVAPLPRWESRRARRGRKRVTTREYVTQWPLSAAHDGAKLREIRRLLHYGPLMALMKTKGGAHWVIIQACDRDWVYVCDPGNVLWNHWAKKRDGSGIDKGARMPRPEVLAKGGDHKDDPARAYVQVSITQKLKPWGVGVTWLSQVKKVVCLHF